MDIPPIVIDTNQSNKVISFMGYHQKYVIIPVHYCFNIHNINQIDLKNSTAEVNAQLILAFNYQSYKQDDLQDILDKLRTQVCIQLSQKQNIILTETNKNVDMIPHKSKGMIAFVVRQQFGAIFCEDVVLTPIEKLNIIFPIKILDISIPPKDWNDKPIKVKFNFMNFQLNKKMQSRNEGCEIYFQDELKIGQYEITTTDTISQTWIYRIPYRIAKAMSLPIINNKDNISYAKITKNKKQPQKKGQIKKNKGQNIQQIIDEDKQPLNKQYQQKISSSSKDQQFLVYDQRYQQRLKINDALNNIPSYKIRSFNRAYINITLFRHPLVGVLTVLLPLLMISFLNYAIFKIRKQEGHQGLSEEQENDDNIQKLTIIITTIAALIELAQEIRKRIPATDKMTFIQILVFCQLIAPFCAIVEILRYKQPPAETLQKSIGMLLTLLTFLAIFFYPIYFYAILKKKYQHKYPMKNPAKQKYLLDKNNWNNKKLLAYIQDVDVLIQKIKKR